MKSNESDNGQTHIGMMTLCSNLSFFNKIRKRRSSFHIQIWNTYISDIKVLLD